MAIHEPDAVVPRSEQPKDDAHWYWLYTQLVNDNEIQRTVSPPGINERRRAVKNFYQTLPREPDERGLSGRRLAASYNRKYELEGLKGSDLNWLMGGSLRDEYVYLAWLCVVRSSPVFGNVSNGGQNGLIGFNIQSYVDSDGEIEAKFLMNTRPEKPKIENQVYEQLGLALQPLRIEELISNIVDFLNLLPLTLDEKRGYVLSVKNTVESAKARQWLSYAKGHGNELYEWLWCYLRGTSRRVNTPYRMPGHISEYLNEFKYERLVAEFALWDKSEQVKHEIHDKTKKATERKLRELQNRATKIRKNFTISPEAVEMLNQLCGGKGKGSDYVDRLIKERYQEVFISNK